jgi:hypothetical protein
MLRGSGVTYEWRPSDHAFEAFLASCGDRFEGDELRMFRFFRSHPAAEEFRAVEAALVAYAKGKKAS